MDIPSGVEATGAKPHLPSEAVSSGAVASSEPPDAGKKLGLFKRIKSKVAGATRGEGSSGPLAGPGGGSSMGGDTVRSL
jgi:hypothetical protein